MTMNLVKIALTTLLAFSLNAYAHTDLSSTKTKTHTTTATTTTTNPTESAHPLKDTEITAKVKEQFIQQKLFDKANVPPLAIHVKTVNGTVFLTGKVNNKEQIDTAIAITKGINGVKEVKSEIELKEAK